MKTIVGASCTLALLASSLPSLGAQGTQPSQPVDPTAQSPSTPAPTTPPTFPTSQAKAQRERRVHMGTIVKSGDAYLLKSGSEKYLLDNQKQVRNYEGKDV